jgi:CBS domain-containing protein
MNRSHPSIYPDELATKARALIRDLKLRLLPVVDDNKQLLGVVSRNDVMTISSSVSVVRVKGIMSAVRFAPPVDMDIVQVAREMMRLDEWYIPVVKSQRDNTYQGVLGLEHVMEAYYDRKAAGLKVPLSEVMSSEQLLVCSPEDEADRIWYKMKERSFAACPVVARKKTVGMITQQDLIESGGIYPAFEAKKGKFKNPPTILTIMRTPALSLKPNDKVEDAVKLMLQKDIGRIPIVDNKGQLVGIVDREDIVRAILK